MNKQRICIVGDGLAGLMTAAVLGQVSGVDISLISKKEKKNLDKRTTAISHTNLKFIQENILRLDNNLFWPSKNIELFYETSEERVNFLNLNETHSNLMYVFENDKIKGILLKEIIKNKIKIISREIKSLKSNLKPHESLFVVDSMIGQDAVLTAKTFNEAIDYDGVVLTKLDGDSRGGSALSIRKVVDKPIKFISTGEKMDAIDVFHPDRMAKRILGMGDVISLVERAQQNFDEEEARKLQKKMFENTFGLDDFLSQILHVMYQFQHKFLVLYSTFHCLY